MLESNANPAAREYQRALREQGTPITSLFSDDIETDYKRLVGLGVTFTKELTQMP